VLRYSLVVVGEGAFFRDCRGIGWMGVMCTVGLVDHSVSDECGGDSGSRVKDSGRQEGKGG
jgi:hypothetical protein